MTVPEPPVRVLVTGSRDWEDRAAVWAAFDRVHAEHPEFVLVSGACPSGADRMAEGWARVHGVRVERYPADWGRHGRAAGPIRNRRMVETAPDLCVAFIRANSRGATGTVRMCVEAGIRTEVVTAD